MRRKRRSIRISAPLCRSSGGRMGRCTSIREASMKAAGALLIFLIFPVLLVAQHPLTSRPLALDHVTVIDGTGSKPRLDQTVVIEGDRITAIARSGRVKLPADGQTVDATGRFLIPGLWDMHVHLGSKSDL